MIGNTHIRIKYLTTTAVGFSLIFYWLIAYQISRSYFQLLIIDFSVIFICYLILVKPANRLNFRTIIWLGVAFRLIIVFSSPSLSNDYFRFIWDGNLISEGLNPYIHLPADLIKEVPFNNSTFYKELFDGMGSLSQNNYTNYPPVNQIIFWIPSLFSKNIEIYIIFYRLVLIAADIGTVIIGSRILKRLNFDKNNIFIFFLNPLIIVEIAGNLHFEGIMIFFFVSSFYLLEKKKYLFSAAVFAFSVLIKLIPLIFLPFVIKRLGLKKGLIFSSVLGVIVFGSYLPFLTPDFISHYGSSLDLYFRKFEFNASIYYIVREIGYHIKGYNIIQSAGPVLSLISTIIILLFAVVQKKRSAISFYTSILGGLTIYYLFATTVHPWYLSVLLIISVFTKYRFVLVWTFFVMLSYYAYSVPDFNEYLLLTVIEYSSVLGYFIFEVIYLKRKRDNIFCRLLFQF